MHATAPMCVPVCAFSYLCVPVRVSRVRHPPAGGRLWWHARQQSFGGSAAAGRSGWHHQCDVRPVRCRSGRPRFSAADARQLLHLVRPRHRNRLPRTTLGASTAASTPTLATATHTTVAAFASATVAAAAAAAT
eukprot:1842997-Prymnesium_polylepis.1